MKQLVVISMFLFFPIFALAQSSLQTPPAESTGLFSGEEMRMVMTFNVAHASNVEAWEERRDVMLELLQQYQPLFIGTQEALIIQLEFFEENLENYAYIGVSRQGNTEDEFSAILYDTSRATVEEEGTFWLSETPDEPGSLMEGEGHPRIVTWGRFTVDEHPNSVYVFNTHLAFTEGVAERMAAVLLEQLEMIVEEGSEVFITGDFNRPRVTHAWQMFQDAGFRDAWQLAEHQDGPNATFHGWRGLAAQGGFEQGIVADQEDFLIDWILYRPASPETEVSAEMLVQVVTNHEGDIYPSDHYPVVLTTLGNPELQASAQQTTPHDVGAHEPVLVTAAVHNMGERGVTEVTLYVDRRPVDSQWLVLDADERRQVDFTTRLYAPGQHEVSVELLPATTVTVQGSPAALTYHDFSAERYVPPGQAVPITATILNTGSFEGSIQANLFIGNTLADTTLVTVPSGESRGVGFVHTFSEPGAYPVAIGNQLADVLAVVDIAGDWLFQRGDDMAWAAPELDGSAWEVVQLPATWESHSDYTEDNVYGWYRNTIRIPAAWEGRPIRLVLGQIDDADMAFFNGEMIGQTGGFPNDEGGFASQWNVTREYDVPSEFIRYGEENTIAVRVYDELGGGGIHRGTLGVLPLDTTQP